MEHDKNHELEQNDLWYFITHFNEYWDRYGNWVTGTVVLVAAIVVGYHLFTRNRAESHEEAWARLDTATGADGYAGVAMDFRSKPMVAALANLRGADDLLSRASVGRGTAFDLEDPASMTAELPEGEERDRALADAEQRYLDVVNARGVHEYVKHNAHLGLAAIAESRGEYDKAAEHYDKVIDSSNATPPMVALATDRKAWLERLKHPVTFADKAVEPMRALPAETGGMSPALEGLNLMPSLSPSGGSDDANSGLTIPGMESGSDDSSTDADAAPIDPAPVREAAPVEDEAAAE